MNNRQRQQQKAIRMVWRAKRSNWPSLDISMNVNALSDAIKKLGESVMALANAIHKSFERMNLSEIMASIAQKEDES